MYYQYGTEETDEFKKFLNMSKEEFDKYMCTLYSNQFDQRNLPMNQTCMCWGFDIDKGWYYYLDQMCHQLDLIEKLTGIGVSFKQIKEKYASGRFYYDILIREKTQEKHNFKIWSQIIDNIVSVYEDFVGYICQETGKRIEKPLYIDHWYYALSENAFEKLFPEKKDKLKKYREFEEKNKKIKDMITILDDNQINDLIQYIENLIKKNLIESAAKAEELIDIDELDTKH